MTRGNRRAAHTEAQVLADETLTTNGSIAFARLKDHLPCAMLSSEVRRR